MKFMHPVEARDREFAEQWLTGTERAERLGVNGRPHHADSLRVPTGWQARWERALMRLAQV